MGSELVKDKESRFFSKGSRSSRPNLLPPQLRTVLIHRYTNNTELQYIQVLKILTPMYKRHPISKVKVLSKKGSLIHRKIRYFLFSTKSSFLQVKTMFRDNAQFFDVRHFLSILYFYCRKNIKCLFQLKKKNLRKICHQKTNSKLPKNSLNQLVF